MMPVKYMSQVHLSMNWCSLLIPGIAEIQPEKHRIWKQRGFFWISGQAITPCCFPRGFRNISDAYMCFHFLSVITGTKHFRWLSWAFPFAPSAPLDLDSLCYCSYWCSVKITWGREGGGGRGPARCQRRLMATQATQASQRSPKLRAVAP